MAIRQILIKGDAEKYLAKLATKQGLQANVSAFVESQLKKLAPQAAGHVIKTQFSGGIAPAYQSTSGSGAKQVKHRRSGDLARSISGRATTYQGFPAFEVGQLRGTGTVLRYGWIQEYGTQGANPDSPFPDIKPRSGRYLAVPQDIAKFPSGLPRVAGPRDWPEPLVPVMFSGLRGENRNVAGMLVAKQEYDNARNSAIASGLSTHPHDLQLEAVYLLITFARIRPGFFLNDGVQDYLPILAAKLADALFREFFS